MTDMPRYKVFINGSSPSVHYLPANSKEEAHHKALARIPKDVIVETVEVSEDLLPWRKADAPN